MPSSVVYPLAILPVSVLFMISSPDFETMIQTTSLTGDNPSLFNILPRDSIAWKKKFTERYSVEHSNKCEKADYIRRWQAPIYKNMVLLSLRHHNTSIS